MNYQETLDWMFAKLPMYQTQGASAYRKDLTNTLLLSEYLEHPERELKFIHVAGTNGKGSTTHMLASIYMEAGYKVGYFTSPHLKDYRERIKIDGQEIPENFVVDFIQQHKPFFDKHDLSFFEMTVGLAFVYFKSENCDIVILETGLGGRLDSTNIATPILSIITNISFDHTQFLGNTLQAIAAEKAGIIKQNIPVVIGEHTSQTLEVFLKKAHETNSEIYFASDLEEETLPSDLKGKYQDNNIRTVMQAMKILRNNPDLPISDESIKNGLLNIVKNTGFAGRWQKLNDKPLTICDTAHNKNGIEMVMQQIQATIYDRLHMVLGFVNDKDLTDILPLFPKEATYYFCCPNIPRGLNASNLQANAVQFGLVGKVYESVSKAYDAAKKNAAAADFIYLGGSTFVVAEII